MSELDDVWMLRAEAATYLRLSVSSLAHMACNGMGPRFYKAGNRARYLKSDLDNWAKSVAFEPLSQNVQGYIDSQGGISSIRRGLRNIPRSASW